MTAQLTHVTVRDTPPPAQVMTIGHLYAIGQEPVFQTVAPSFTEDEASDAEAEEKDFTDDVEAKVVKRGRRPARPKSTEAAETK